MVKIAEITAQNPWWAQAEEIAWYDQHLVRAKPIFFERKQIELQKGNIYIVRGPRQVGKTTYLKDLVRKLIQKGVCARDILYLSMDFFTSRREMRNAISYYLDSRRDASTIYLLLDEITYLNEYYIKPLDFREFVIQSIANDSIIHDSDGQATSSDEFTDTIKRLKSLMPSCSIDLASNI